MGKSVAGCRQVTNIANSAGSGIDVCMKKVALYARVSSDLQTKERTIDSQVAELKMEIEKSGARLVKEYVDDGYSGALLDRPAMNRLREDIKTKKFETIYFHNADRIARDVTYQNIIIGEFLQNKKQIIINGEDYIHNPENKFTLTVLGAVAELERAKITERSRRGAVHRLKQGHLLGNGSRIYGYLYTKKKDAVFPSYAIHPEEAKIVKLIFSKYLQEEIGYKPMARYLNKVKASRRSNVGWTAPHIKSILHNETYTGTKYFLKYQTEQNPITGKKRQFKRDRSEWIGLSIPAIIDTDLFEQVQKKIKHNLDCYRNPARIYLLSQLVFCGKCQTRCYAYRRYYKVKRKYRTAIYQRASYKCRVCSNPEINTAVLESVVHDIFTNTVLEPDELINYIPALRNKKSNTSTKDKLKRLSTKLKKLKIKEGRLTELYEGGQLSYSEYTEQIPALDIEKLQAQKSKLINSALLIEEEGVVKEALRQYCVELTKQFDYSRQFYLKYTKQVTHQKLERYDRITVLGSFTVEIQGESVEVDWQVERRIDRVEIAKQLKKDPANLEQIMKKEYGELLLVNTKEL